MRLEKQTVKDHDLMQETGEDDHHPRGTSYTILINSQNISAYSTYEHRYDLGKSGHQVIRAFLRGSESVDIQGHTGAFVIGSDTQQDSSGVSIRPYGSSYVTSYMGAYSRIHGDSYLTHVNLFGTSIMLRDVYIDGTEAVLEFYNSASVTRTLSVYGTVVVK